MYIYIKYLVRYMMIVATVSLWFSLSAIAPVAGPRHGERCRRKKKEASWRKRGCGEDAGPRTKTISRRHVHAVKKVHVVSPRQPRLGLVKAEPAVVIRIWSIIKTRAYTCIMATHSSIQGSVAEQKRKLVRFVMLINWLTFPSYYCTANRKLLSREALEKRAPRFCAHSKLSLQDLALNGQSQRFEETCWRFRR